MLENKILIETKDLSKYYEVPRKKLFEKQRYVKAVEKISLKIPKGCTYGLVGESGCGKSTTGKMLAGIFGQTEGTIIFDGQDIDQLDKASRRRTLKKIQMIFQDPYSSLNPKKKIGWILEEPLKTNTGISAGERKKHVVEVLKTVGLDADYTEKYPSELSGGQRQRISIAAALLLDPECIIADEAVSALDVSVQAQILNLLKKLQEERGLTYLFISHDLNVVEFMSDYIAVMYLGNVVECGTAEEVCRHPLHPYTQSLLSAVLDVRGPAGKRIVLEGEVPSPVDTPSGCPFHTRCQKAQDICRKEKPCLNYHGTEHQVSCHFAKEI